MLRMRVQIFLLKKKLGKNEIWYASLCTNIRRRLGWKEKSLQVVEKSNECHLNNVKELRDDLAMCENKYQGSSNPTNVGQVITLVTKLAASLKEMKGDLQFHELLLISESSKVKDGEIELKDAHERL